MQTLDGNLENLLDRFEKEVQPYDRLSTIGLVITPVAVVLTILVGWLLVPWTVHSTLYLVIGGILGTVAASKLPILYADYKKHQISNRKYKPLSGGKCMCDLSQLRYHIRRLDKSNNTGERIRHMQFAKYYRARLGLE